MLTPEVAPATKEKRKRSAKSKRETPPQQLDATIQGHLPAEPGPVPASIPPESPSNGLASSPSKQTYDWDRTVEEDKAKETKRVADAQLANVAFPTPRAKTLPSPDFCAYWNQLIGLPVGRYGKLYIHRWFPVLLPVEIEDARLGMKRESFPGEDILKPEDGPLSEQLLLDRVGVGDYTIRLNDTRRPWGQGTIVNCETWRTKRDYDHYPPIFDLKRLDYEDRANEVYIKHARAKGILPQQNELEKDDEDMANAEIVNKVLETNQTLTRTLLDQAKNQPQAAAAKPESDNGGAIGTAMKSMADVVTAALSRPAPSGPDLKEVAGIVKSLIPERDTAAADLAKEVVKNAKETNDKIFQMQEDRIKAAEKTAAAPPAVPAVQPTRVQMLQDAVTEKELLAKLAGRGSATHEEESKPSQIDKWLEALPLVMPIVGQMFSGALNFGIAWLQTSQVTSYNNALLRNGGTPPQPPTLMNTNGQQNQPKPGEPIPPQAPPPSPEQTAAHQAFGQIMANVVKIAPYMIRHINKGKSGAEFAEFVIENAPDERADYDRIRGIVQSLTQAGMQVPGESDLEKFLNACRFIFEKYPPLWSKVGTVPTMPQFLTDFYNYDQILNEANQENAPE